MARIICDSYIKGEKQIWGDDPSAPFNQKVLAVNDMYGWLYEKGILEKVSFVFKDYAQGTHFALDAEDLKPYRSEMEASCLSGAALAVHHIFDEEYTPCMYSGAIELGWTMSGYRNVDGCVGRSWECSLMKSLDVKGAYEVFDVLQQEGVKRAVISMFDHFQWNPTLDEQKKDKARLDDVIQNAASRSSDVLSCGEKTRSSEPER